MGLAQIHRGAGMRQARDDTHQDGRFQLLGKGEGLGDHVVGFLLVRGLEDGHHGELGVEAAVLLVLGRMHRRVVGREHDQAPVHAGDGAVDEGVGADVHAYVLHADEGPLAGIGHAEGRFHCSFFVGAPAAVDAALPRDGILLDKLRDLGRRRAGVGVYAGQAGVNRSKRDGFVAEKKLAYAHLILLTLKGFLTAAAADFCAASTSSSLTYWGRKALPTTLSPKRVWYQVQAAA